MMDGLGVEEIAAAGAAASGAWDNAYDDGTEDGACGEGPAMGLAFEAFLNPMELKMARRFVADLAPRDAQEEVHAWHLAASHLLAAQRIGKSRQDGLSARAEQIEIGLAVRLMALADRKSASLDRHRIAKLREDELFWQRAAARACREAGPLPRSARPEPRAAQEDVVKAPAQSPEQAPGTPALPSTGIGLIDVTA